MATKRKNEELALIKEHYETKTCEEISEIIKERLGIERTPLALFTKVKRLSELEIIREQRKQNRNYDEIAKVIKDKLGITRTPEALRGKYNNKRFVLKKESKTSRIFKEHQMIGVCELMRIVKNTWQLISFEHRQRKGTLHPFRAYNENVEMYKQLLPLATLSKRFNIAGLKLAARFHLSYVSPLSVLKHIDQLYICTDTPLWFFEATPPNMLANVTRLETEYLRVDLVKFMPLIETLILHSSPQSDYMSLVSLLPLLKIFKVVDKLINDDAPSLIYSNPVINKLKLVVASGGLPKIPDNIKTLTIAYPDKWNATTLPNALSGNQHIEYLAINIQDLRGLECIDYPTLHSMTSLHTLAINTPYVDSILLQCTASPTIQTVIIYKDINFKAIINDDQQPQSLDHWQAYPNYRVVRVKLRHNHSKTTYIKCVDTK
eukprot:gene7930-9320_t